MSVINQMLKDLEKRGRSSMHAELALPDMPVTVFFPYKKIAKKSWIMVVFFFLLCVLLIISYKFFFTQHHSAVAPSVNKHIQPKIMTSGAVNDPVTVLLHLTPAIVTAITLQLQKETTSLRLLLSQDALYQVSTNNKNQLIILLENARLVTSLPSLNAMNSAIQTLKMINQRNGNLKMVLTLKTGVELTHLELNEMGKLPELQLDLLSTADSASVQTNLTVSNTYKQEKADSIIKLRTDISMSDQYQQALRLSTQGRSNEAMIVLTELLAKDPEYTAARESLASLLMTQGNIIKAEQVIKIGLQQRPFYPGYMQLKARILVNEGKVDQALHLLQLAPPALSTHPDYHAFIAALYQRQGQPLFAERLYEQLLALQPNNATWWMGLGIALESMGKRTLAIEAYLKARNSDHLNPELKIYAETRIHHLQ